MSHQSVGIRPLVEASHVPVSIDDLGGHRLAVVDRELDVDTEELGGHEDPNLLVALREDTQRRRLHPAGRQPSVQTAAQQRGDRETDHAVEESAGLLRTHEVVVDLARTLESGLHRSRSDLGEGDPTEALLGPPEQLAQVPGDGLTLAVKVGGKVDGAVPTEPLQFTHHFRLRVDDFPRRLPTGLDVEPKRHGQARLGPSVPARTGGTP